MRFYHPGTPHHLPAHTKHPQHGEGIPTPPMFRDQHGPFLVCRQGSIVVAIPQVGIFIAEPGGYVDIPHGVSLEVVKNLAGTLLTEDEAVDKGIAKKTQTVPTGKKPPAGDKE